MGVLATQHVLSPVPILNVKMDLLDQQYTINERDYLLQKAIPSVIKSPLLFSLVLILPDVHHILSVFTPNLPKGLTRL